MKQLIVLTIITLLVGCGTKESNIKPENHKQYEDIDSIISKSQENIAFSNEIIQRGDSAVSQKIEKTAQKIDKLETEVKVLKQENNELKTKIKRTTDPGESFELLPVSRY